MKGAAELVGKEPGADPDNLTSREKTTLIKDISETLGVNAESLLKEVGIARSTYYYQLKAMRRPDKNANLLSLVREAFGSSRRRYGTSASTSSSKARASSCRPSASCA